MTVIEPQRAVRRSNMASITATWTKVAAAEQLQRSSHCLTTVGSTAYVFGGELKPREPRDNDVHTVSIDSSAAVKTSKSSGNAPSPRVGSASTSLHGNVYLFSGRGGVAMAPVDEQGALWQLDAATAAWSLIEPASKSDNVPEARSYHAIATDGGDTIFLHAGCPEKGRLDDLWAFGVKDRRWRRLPNGPAPARGGTSIAFTQGKLYRMNGFDGTTEQGGSLDVFDPKTGEWSTITYDADGKNGPGARSVAALVPVTIDGKASLVTLFGESDPSSLGHQGAGKMLSDVWAYSLDEGKWSQVSSESDVPQARGWFDADVIEIEGKEGIVVSGGLGESNERLDDLWTLRF